MDSVGKLRRGDLEAHRESVEGSAYDVSVGEEIELPLWGGGVEVLRRTDRLGEYYGVDGVVFEHAGVLARRDQLGGYFATGEELAQGVGSGSVVRPVHRGE